MRLDIVTDHIFYYNQKFEGFRQQQCGREFPSYVQCSLYLRLKVD